MPNMSSATPPTSISVHVRLRPWKENDGPHTKDAISLSASTTISVPNPQRAEQRFKFTLDGCHGPETEQEDLFVKVKPIVEQVYKGINATVFAYGVTGSGKTWTMQGSPSDPGIIPRVVKSIFDKQDSGNLSMRIAFSYVEILMEEIFDLLVPKNVTKKLDVRTNAKGENVIPDLTKKEIKSASEFETLYQLAAQSRKTAATKLNSNSSRSHAILTIYVESSDPETQQTFLGKICLVDLAGSEDNNLTGNDPIRMRESSAINRSLTTLGSVVEALNSKASRIPYRDSKLTRILQDALGGSSIGVLICNLAPGNKFAKEALRTLKFATRTRELENKPVVNAKAGAAAKGTIASQNRGAGGQAESAVTLAIQSVDSPHSHDLNQAIVAEIQRSGLALTKQELDNRIQNVVKSMMESSTHSEQQKRQSMEIDKAILPSSVDDSEDERKARAKVLINLARTHHDKGELELSLEYYRKAKIYVPENQKLTRRIAEIELASMGQIPLPKRAGSSKVQDATSECIVPIRKAASPVPEGSTCPGAFREDAPTGHVCYTESSDKQPKLRRSKALSRPLADITKNVNVAPRVPEQPPVEKDGGRMEKAKGDTGSKHNKAPGTGQSMSQINPRKLDVYRDPPSMGAVPKTLYDAQPRRLAATRAGAINYQLACDDSGVTDIDMLDGDEYIPQEDLSRSIKRRRV